MAAFRYRNKTTGRFISKKNYKAAKKRGSKKVKRETIRKNSRYIFRTSYVSQQSDKGRTVSNGEIHFIAPRGIDAEKFIEGVTNWLTDDTLPRGWKRPELVIWRAREWESNSTEGEIIKNTMLRTILAGATTEIEEKATNQKVTDSEPEEE
jgi:hypothetical protein